MRCGEWRRRLERRLDGRLTIEATLALEEHASRCERCAAELERARAVEDLLGALPAPPVERLDVDGALRTVGRRLDAGSAERAPRRAPVAGLAAGLAAAGALALVLARGSSGPPADGGSAHGAHPAPAEAVAPGPFRLAVESAPLDRDRLARARETIRTALREAGAELPELASASEVDALDARVRARLRDRLAGGWPLVRHVEALARDPDRAVARPALRWLGRAGDRLALAELRAARARPDLARPAALALLDAHRRGHDTLAEALVGAGGAIVVARLGEDERPSAARLVARLLERPTTDARPDPGILVRLGAVGARELIALADAGALPEDEVLGLLAATPGADTEALAELGRRPRAFAARACATLRPPGAVPVLRDLCLDDEDLRDEAWTALLAFDGAPALEAAVVVHRVGRAGRESAAPRLERDVRGVEELVGGLAVGEDGTAASDAAALLTFLADAGGPGAVDGLAALLAAAVLEREDRLICALAIGDLAAENARPSPPALAATFGRCDARDSRLAAACLIAIRRFDGPDGARRVLSKTTERTTASLLRLLDACEPRATGIALARLSRALEPTLAPRPERRSSP